MYFNMLLGPKIESADAFELAKEMSLAMAFADIPPDEDTLRLMLKNLNSSLMGAKDNKPSIVKAGAAFCITNDEIELEFMSEKHISESMVPEPVMKGNVYSFEWLGSVPLTGFGLRMFDVDFIEPKEDWTETLFIPVETIDYRILFSK